jgi:hypothetical protein
VESEKLKMSKKNLKKTRNPQKQTLKKPQKNRKSMLKIVNKPTKNRQNPEKKNIKEGFFLYFHLNAVTLV